MCAPSPILLHHVTVNDLRQYYNIVINKNTAIRTCERVLFNRSANDFGTWVLANISLEADIENRPPSALNENDRIFFFFFAGKKRRRSNVESAEHT